MSSCVANSPSPFPNTSAINTRALTTSYTGAEDSFDQTSFPFLDADHGMDYYLASTPEPSTSMHEENVMARPPPPIMRNPSRSQVGNSEQATGRNHEDVSMGPAESEMAQVALDDYPRSTIDLPDTFTMTQPHEILPYNNNYGYTAMAIHDPPKHQHSSHFHPYRYDGYRSPRYAYSPPDPLSPPLSISPPGSAHSHHALSLSQSPPQAVSPAIVSPASVIGSMSDGSPGSGIWAYNLPHAVGSSPYAGTPLTSIMSLPNMSGSPPGPPGGMLRMVAGSPYHALPIGMVSAKDAVKPARPKPSKKHSTGRPVTKKEVEKENAEGESEGEDELDLDEEVIPPRGKSIFTPEEIRGPNLTEEVRKARIKSEQRRRDELREGFKRLREALPNSNQRPSKSSILDRSVAHIQQLTAANHWLQNQMDQANAELHQLRAINAELIRTLTGHSRSAQGSGSSPESSGRGGQ